MSWWCKGSTLSRQVRGLGLYSRVRTLFSIDLCCIYLVFTMSVFSPEPAVPANCRLGQPGAG